jgi:hypothetical protein
MKLVFESFHDAGIPHSSMLSCTRPDRIASPIMFEFSTIQVTRRNTWHALINYNSDFVNDLLVFGHKLGLSLMSSVCSFWRFGRSILPSTSMRNCCKDFLHSQSL